MEPLERIEGGPGSVTAFHRALQSQCHRTLGPCACVAYASEDRGLLTGLPSAVFPVLQWGSQAVIFLQTETASHSLSVCTLCASAPASCLWNSRGVVPTHVHLLVWPWLRRPGACPVRLVSNRLCRQDGGRGVNQTTWPCDEFSLSNVSPTEHVSGGEEGSSF